MKRIGIIGVGHLGSALLSGLFRSHYVSPNQVYISGGSSNKVQTLADQLGCHFCTSNIDVVKNSDILILAVTPRIMPTILKEIQQEVTAKTVVVSVASSFTLEQYYQYLSSDIAVLRAICTIPSAVCQGMTAITPASQVTPAQLEQVKALFIAVGKILLVEEHKLDISSTVAGCSPAYVALFIEALADAGVLAGLSREESYLLSEQAVLGAATILLEKQLLPAQLKDSVCSPGGTTIRGVAKLEKYGLRNAVIEAVKASAKIED